MLGNRGEINLIVPNKCVSFSQNPPDIISQSEALLVRFQSDETMVFKGFSVSYVAVVPFDDDEEMSSDSEETATPFPGSLKSIYSHREEVEEGEDDGVDGAAAGSGASAVHEDGLLGQEQE